MKSGKDNLYSSTEASCGSFVFDQRVASVFADMISRSVPGYQQILHMLPTISKQFEVQGANYYDLGCSLGAGLLAISQGLRKNTASLIGIDNSKAMIERARSNLSTCHQNIELREENLSDTSLNNAAMVLMNFTLQFIPLAERVNLIRKIFDGMIDGGVLILSEKICFEDEATHGLLTRLHHQYKSDQGYSELEISRKRDAIDQVLIPETLEQHVDRLKTCGFKVVTPWVQNLQFVSLLAIK